MGAYGQIDYCYYMLEEMSKPQKLLSPIEIAIDNATGYKSAKEKETCKTAISLLKCIIKNKKFIEADFSGDAKALKELKECYKNMDYKTKIK